MRIEHQDLPALARGVALLGSGGGGDTATAVSLLRRWLDTGRRVSVTPVDELSPDARVVPIGMVGAVAAFAEKVPGGSEFRAAVGAITRWTGDPVHAVMSVEMGGVNGMLPLVAAADLELATADADLTGRGVPRLDQLAVAATGHGLVPAALAGPSGQVVMVTSGTPADVEQMARSFLTAAGGWAILALTPIPAAELAGRALTGTVRGALELGRRALSAGVESIAELTGGRVLGLGRAVEVAWRAGPVSHGRAGFGRGSVTVRDHASAALLRLEMENEYLVALRDGSVVATTPDVLAVLDRRTGAPILCDAVRPGLEVAVLQLPAPDFWLEPTRLPVVEPRAYGIDTEPVLLRADERTRWPRPQPPDQARPSPFRGGG